MSATGKGTRSFKMRMEKGFCLGSKTPCPFYNRLRSHLENEHGAEVLDNKAGERVVPKREELQEKRFSKVIHNNKQVTSGSRDL